MKMPTAAAPAAMSTSPTFCAATGVLTLRTLRASTLNFDVPHMMAPASKISSMITSRISATPRILTESCTSR